MMRNCASGMHQWCDSAQKEKLAKCCVTHVPIWIAVKFVKTPSGDVRIESDEDNLHPYDEKGGANFALSLIPIEETERIARLRAREQARLWRRRGKFAIPN